MTEKEKQTRVDAISSEYPEWEFGSIVYELGVDEALIFADRAISANKDLRIIYDEEKLDGGTVIMIDRKE